MTNNKDPLAVPVAGADTVDEKIQLIEVAEMGDSNTPESKPEMDADADAREEKSNGKSNGKSNEKSDKKSNKETDHTDNPAVAAKKQQIRHAIAAADRARLQQLAVSPGGFLSDDLRQLAWPLLLGIPVSSDGDHVDPVAAAAAAGMIPSAGASANDNADDWTRLPAHRDEDQVQLDVNRAFVHYPRGLGAADEARQRQQLSDLIVGLLRRHPFLCYFQGFHDIAQVFLLVLAATPEVRAPAVTRLALLRIRDFMLPTIDAAVQQLQLLPDILRAADPALWDHLRLAQHPRPFFALSGTLTMYAHDVQTLGAIARVFDALLARPPALSLYLFAAIACAHRDALFATPADEPEMLHHILSKLPARAGDDEGNNDRCDRGDSNNSDSDSLFGAPRAAASLDCLIADADRLYRAHPPHTLAAWRAIPAASVLKTVVDVADDDGYNDDEVPQTVEDGERLFHEHVAAIARAERRRQQVARMRKVVRQYRGPIRAVGVAVVVGVLAVVLQRSGYGRGFSSSSSHSHSHALLSGPLATVTTLLSRLGIHLG